MLSVKEQLLDVRVRLYGAGVKIVYKDSHWFWRALGWLVMVVTFGQVKDFINGSTTTLGKTIALPRNAEKWSDLTWLETLSHEEVHVNQFRKFTPVLFGLLYILFPIPFGLAWFRYWSEREAYAVGFRILIANGYNRDSLIAWVTETLGGSSYGWAWPKASVAKWFKENV